MRQSNANLRYWCWKKPNIHSIYVKEVNLKLLQGDWTTLLEISCDWLTTGFHKTIKKCQIKKLKNCNRVFSETYLYDNKMVNDISLVKKSWFEEWIESWDR